MFRPPDAAADAAAKAAAEADAVAGPAAAPRGAASPGAGSADTGSRAPVTASRRRAFLVVLALVLAYEGYAFFIKEAGETQNIASRDDWHLTGEVAGEAALVQGLVTHADGFEGIDVWAHASGGPPPGPLDVLVTADRGAGREAVARVSYPAAQVVAAPQPFHVTIPRVDQSAGQHFELHIAAPLAPRGQGVRFEASGPAYPEGTLSLGGREEWGDLQFRTTAERSTIYRNLRHVRQGAPALVRSDLFLALMLLLFNGAIATLLYDFVFAPGTGERLPVG
jgi:hypothetical protein